MSERWNDQAAASPRSFEPAPPPPPGGKQPKPPRSSAAKVCTPDKCAYGNFCCPNGCKDEVELDAPSPLLGFPVYEDETVEPGTIEWLLWTVHRERPA